jgi:hypothetical protein
MEDRHHQSHANEPIPGIREQKLMKPTTFPVGQANRAPEHYLPKQSQILIKSIGSIEVWDVQEKTVDFEEIWIDLTVESESKEWETRLVFDNSTQAEEFITKLAGALAQRAIEKSIRQLIRRTK